MDNSKPNIVLITIDALRSDRLGCYGHPSAISPHIDRLARDGSRFSQAITGGSWTQAAFPGILTSTHASMYGGCVGPLSPRRPSPVEQLAAHGYQTAGFTTNPLLGDRYDYGRGFDHFCEIVPREKDTRLRRITGGQYLLRQPIFHGLAGLFGRSLRPAKKYSSAVELVDWVEKWVPENETPYFLWAHFMDVHWPYHVEDELDTPGAIAAAWRDLSFLHTVNWKGGRMTPEMHRRLVALYEYAVRYTDKQVGRLVNLLHETGNAENTIFIITADHGEEFLDRKRWGHVEVNLYDEIVRVPLIICGPGIPRGAVFEGQVSLLDLMPTILDYCGVPCVEGMQGMSLKPVMEGEPGALEGRIVLSERYRDNSHMVAVRRDGWKLIWFREDPENLALYNLIDDPGERSNLVQAYPDIAREFLAYIQEHLARVAQTSPEGEIEPPEMDQAFLARLRGLGYLE